MSYFSDNYYNLLYPISIENKSGLRNAQLGAIHAIGSFLTLHKKLSGIIVMPTGSGKTSVIMMTPYLALSKKVLVVTSSKMVRGHIFEDFSHLINLKELNVLDIFTNPPDIFEMKKLYPEKAECILSADVVIATYQCALSIAKNEIKDTFDLVLIDEAHHIPAPTWQQILLKMKHAKHFLFTATPFRMDKKEIKGEIIYNYPLSMAYQDGIFGDIQYIPVEEAPEKDILVAKETERIFFNDKQNGYNHFVMARTDTKEKALNLEKIYSQETILRLKRIDSSMIYTTIKKIIEDLKGRKIDGIICVNMLGEGFDFPNLKIAAIHSPQKSLASILQFIGRFARTNADDIGTAKFIAMNDEEFTIENNKLFTNDAIWQKMIIDMSQHRIHSEEGIKENLASYCRDDGTSTWEDDFSLYSLRPNCHSKVFRVLDFNINGEFPDTCCIGNNIYRNTFENTIIAIGTVAEKPKWTTSNQINDINNFLYVIHYQAETSLLFIYSQIKTEIDYQEIAKSFSNDFNKIIRSEIHRVLGDMNGFELFNTGMQSRSPDRGESYRILAGSNVASSIDPITGRMFSPGHVFCKAIDNEGNEVTIGYSSGSKIWSSKYLLVPDYVKWCDMCGNKIVNNSLIVKTNTNYDNMPMPSLLEKYPEKIIFSFLSNRTYSSPPILVDKNGNLTNLLLTDSNIKILEQDEKSLSIEFSIEDLVDIVICDINGSYNCANPIIHIKNGRKIISLSDYLNSYPLFFKVTDGTVIVGNESSTEVQDIEIFPVDQIQSINWEQYQTDTACEFGDPGNGKKSIHDVVCKIINKEDNLDVLLYDHGTGEIADFISMKENTDSIEITLYHIKSMKGSKYNKNVDDIYEVCHQGIKSLIWLKSKLFFLEKIKKRQKSEHCKIIKGTNHGFENILKRNKLFTSKIVTIQPAIKKTDISEKFQEVLAAANMYIRNSGRATEFCIWGS